jgi:hypothetical protein
VAQQDVEIVAEYLDAHVATHAREQFVHAHANRQGDFVIGAREIVRRLFDIFQQLAFGL